MDEIYRVNMQNRFNTTFEYTNKDEIELFFIEVSIPFLDSDGVEIFYEFSIILSL